MAILDTFYLLFKSNASDVQKDTEKLNDTLKNTESIGNRVGDSFLSMGKSLVGFAAAGLSIGAVLGGIKSAVDYTIALGQTSNALGVSAEALDAWGGAVQTTGGTLQGFEQSLRGLSQHLGSNAKVALQALPQFADAFHQMSRAQAMMYGKSLGLDESTILLLQKGRREVDDVIKRQKELGAVNKQDTEIALKFNTSLNDTSRAFRSVFIEVGATVLPALTKILDLLIPVAQFFRRHTDLIVGGLIGIATAAGIAAVAFGFLTSPITLTIIAVTALIAAFALLYDDLKAFAEGHDSLTGRILKRWPIIGTVVSNVIDEWKIKFQAFLDLIHLVESAFQKVVSFFKGSPALEASINTGRQNLALASSSSLGSQTSNSILNSSALNNQVRNITTGPITINTQATDADGIGQMLGKSLQVHLDQVNSDVDDGRLA